MLLYKHFLTFYRAEQQRNQALLNAEKLKEAFSDYKAKITTKLHQVDFILSVLFICTEWWINLFLYLLFPKCLILSFCCLKMMENEGKLKESLIECEREKEELEKRCTVLDREKEEQSQTIWCDWLLLLFSTYKLWHLLKEINFFNWLMIFSWLHFPLFSQLKLEVRRANAASAGFQAQMKEMEQKVSDLEQRLKEHGAKCRELASLRNRVDELQSLTQNQEQSMAQSQREAQQKQAELASLEAILGLLHLREVEKCFLSINQFFTLIPTLVFEFWLTKYLT